MGNKSVLLSQFGMLLSYKKAIEDAGGDFNAFCDIDNMTIRQMIEELGPNGIRFQFTPNAKE